MSKGKKGSQGGKPRPQGRIDGDPFHSAVNRIPLPRPSVLADVDKDILPWELFGDGKAFGHDHLLHDRWSGTVELEIVVRTPLVYGQQVRPRGKNGPAIVSVPMYDGKPFIPSTMLKGAMSRAYETLTASRFRLFDRHDQALTYRVDPAAANGLYGGRVLVDPETKEISVEVFKGDDKTPFAYFSDVKPRDFHSNAEYDDAGRLSALSVSAIPSGSKVTVHARKIRGKLIVTSVRLKDRWVQLLGAPEDSEKPHVLEGYLCRTTPDGKRVSELFGTKKYERLFFHSVDEAKAPEVLPVDRDTYERYCNVLRAYVTYSDEPGGDKHLLNRAAQRLKDDPDGLLHDGDLVFVLPRGKGEDHFSEFDILPTMVGRRPYDCSPRELAEKQGVAPLRSAREASPADRLFGYVVDSPAKDAKRGNVAYRGRIVFGPIETTDVRVVNEDKKGQPLHHLLPVLLSPKLSSARRFITDSQGATPMKGKRTLMRGEYFSKGQFLGAAAYPVHRPLLNLNSLPKATTQANGLPSSDKVHLYVESYISPKSRMRCQITVTNLSSEELGLLLWLLTPENLVPKRERAAHTTGCLRMGLGKPLGLGAFEVRVAEGGLRVRRGQQQVADYVSLNGVFGMGSEDVSPEPFNLRIPGDLDERSWVQAFQRAAYGYSSGRVRYMTLDENKKNNVPDPKTGKPRLGYGLSPQDLWGEKQGVELEVPMK